MNTIYDKGDRARVYAEFTDLNGNPVDPTSITVTVKAPNRDDIDTLAPVQVVQTATGRYHFDVDLDAEGTWRFKWTVTGALHAAEEGHLKVRPSYVG